MKNGNLAPTLHSLCLCMWWQGDTRSALLVSNVTAFVESIRCYLPYMMNSQDRTVGEHRSGCACGSAHG